MKDLFFMGGPLFMSILTISFIAMIVWTVYHLLAFTSSKQNDKELALRNLSYGKSIGLFALIMGVLGQLIGLYMAFSAIEAAGNISPSLVYSGLKVSLVTTIYGVLIYIISIITWFASSVIIEKKK